MNETKFIDLVQLTFRHLSDTLEKQVQEKADIDFLEDVLQITTLGGEIWLLNRHIPRQELWLSSPISGGLHFKFWEQKEQWLSSRSSQDELFSFLEHDLFKILNLSLDLHPSP